MEWSLNDHEGINSLRIFPALALANECTLLINQSKILLQFRDNHEKDKFLKGESDNSQV